MDEIVGIAILSDPSPHDGYQYLFITCSSPTRKTVQTAAIPIVEASKADPSGKGWKYKIVGDNLDCSPSLKMMMPVDFEKPNGAMRETFHNLGTWSVRFERAALDEASEKLHALNQELRDKLRERFK